jgi:glycosyltransferase involved in cell wall biosynthesis
MLGWEFPPFSSGGLGTHCYELSKALAARGVQIDFFMPKTRYDIRSPWMEIHQVDWAALSAAGAKPKLPPKYGAYYSPGSPASKAAAPPSNAGASKTYDFNFFEAVSVFNYLSESLIAKLHAERGFDAVHCHDWITSRAGISLSENAGLPFVLTMHSTEYDRTADLWPFEWILEVEREAMAKADQVITVSRRSADQLRDRLGGNPEKINVIYNAIDSEKFPSEKLGLSDAGRESKVVLYHGRLSVQKGVEFFLRSAAKVLSTDRDVRFVVSGNGDMLPRLVEMGIDLGIQDKVSFLGYVSDEHLKKIFATADLFVLPSVSEPFGIAALEAMASGVPVIVSKTSGVAELVKNCLVVDFWDVDEMASKMLAVLKYAPLHDEMRDNSLAEVKRITWDHAAEMTIAVYSKAVAAGAGNKAPRAAVARLT